MYQVETDCRKAVGEMRTDGRVRYTQMVIKDSFVKLLGGKPVNKVTVKEICQLSEINRATFYKHYSDAYDLLEKLEQEFLAELRVTVEESREKGFRHVFALILERMKASGEVYRILSSENGDKNFQERVFALGYQYIEMDTDKQFETLSPVQKKWLYYFLARGCSGILGQWLADGMGDPVEDVVDFADRLIQNTLNTLNSL